MSQVRTESLKPIHRGNVFLGAGAFLNRVAARVGMAVFFGGFTFYAAVVVPDLHSHLGGMETGEISRRVALYLYAIGALALGLTWLRVVFESNLRTGWRGLSFVALLLFSTLILSVLGLMHRSLGQQLDQSLPMDPIRSFHEKYLTVWTILWLAMVGLFALDALRTSTQKVQGSALDPVEPALVS